MDVLTDESNIEVYFAGKAGMVRKASKGGNATEDRIGLRKG